MGVFSLVRRKAAELSVSFAEELRRTERALGQREPVPEDARYRIGDIIHTAGCGIPLGDLKVLDIMAGGYANVYIVEMLPSGKRFALKSYQDWCLNGLHESRRFLREAEAWIRLGKHPNIVYAQGFHAIHGRPHLVLEYVDGGDLYDLMREKPMPVRRALEYSIQICRGMVHAGQAIPGFVHRDIKPGNFLVSREGVLKITDFGQVTFSGAPQEFSEPPGSVKLSSRRPHAFATPRDHWGAGTPSYMAPEQFDSGFEADVRTDIYSFGATLYEMLTAIRLVISGDHAEAQRLHKTVVPKDPVALYPAIPRSLADLVLACLAKRRGDRPAGFDVLEAKLSEILWSTFRVECDRQPSVDLTDDNLAHRGAALAVLGFAGEAIDCFDNLLGARPGLETALTLKGRTLANLGRHNEALACFEQQVALHPEAALGWAGKGAALSRLGRSDEAASCFDRALDLDDKLAFVWREKGQIVAASGSLDEAEVLLTRALALDRRQAETHVAIGLVNEQRGRFPEALDAFKEALALDSRSAEAYKHIGRVYLALQKPSEAARMLVKAVNLDPADENAQADLALAYRKLERLGSPLVAETCADLVTAFLLDYLPQLDFGQPVYIIEPGAGTGRFSYHFLRKLAANLTSFAALNNLDARYVAAESRDAEVELLEANDRLRTIWPRPLDFAVYHAGRGGDLFLLSAAAPMTKESLRNPLLVLANDFFNRLPVKVKSETGAVVPAGALNWIRDLLALSGGKLVLLATHHEGTARAEVYRSNGAFFSNSVNHDAIREYTEAHRGVSISSPISTGPVLMMSVFVPEDCARLEHTRYRFREGAERFTSGMLDFGTSLLQEGQTTEPPEIAAYLSLLESSRFDVHVFRQCSEQLYTVMKEKAGLFRTERLLQCLEGITRNLDPDHADQDTYYLLGKMYYRLDSHDRCAEVFEESIRRFGPDSRSLYFLGACREVQNRHSLALTHYREALAMDPSDELCSEAVERLSRSESGN